MLLVTLGSALMYYATTQSVKIEDKPAGTVYYRQVVNTRHDSPEVVHARPVTLKPLVETQFRGIVKQAYDYSCGSAALTTLLNGYIGTKLTEQQTMDGLLRYGEYDRIVSQRSFSLLDMKRFVTTLGYDSGGFKGSFKDLIETGRPVIVPISYAGFKHFVVVKGHRDGRIFIADPALGNISFTDAHFQEVWDNNILFMVTPAAGQDTGNMLALNEKDMRIVDDRTVNYLAFTEPRLANFRMTQLADQAGSVRVIPDNNPDSPTFQQNISQPLRLYLKQK